MVRILLILVGVGVLLNALTFLTVAHYFSSKNEEAAALTLRPSASPAQEPPQNAEVLRRLSTLESSLSALGRKMDALSARPAVAPPAASLTRNGRGRPAVPRRPGGAAAADGAEEPAAAEESGGQSPPVPLQPRTDGSAQDPPAPPAGAESRKEPSPRPEAGEGQPPGGAGGVPEGGSPPGESGKAGDGEARGGGGA